VNKSNKQMIPIEYTWEHVQVVLQLLESELHNIAIV